MSTPYAGVNNFPATIPVPADSDPPNASLFSTPYEGLADRTTWLKNRVPQLFEAKRYSVAHIDGAFGVNQNWTTVGGGPSLPTDAFVFLTFPATDVVAGDILVVDLDMTIELISASSPDYVFNTLMYENL